MDAGDDSEEGYGGVDGREEDEADGSGTEPSKNNDRDPRVEIGRALHCGGEHVGTVTAVGDCVLSVEKVQLCEFPVCETVCTVWPSWSNKSADIVGR